MNKIIILLLGVLLMSSCSDKKNIDGKWSDIIKLSVKKVDFSAKADSVIITTKGDWWWIDEILFGDTIYSYNGRNDINLESDSYTIKEDCFVVERRDKNTLFVKLNENDTGEKRVMTIGIEAGDYFDGVTINQAAN